MEPWNVTDVVVRQGAVAAIKELTRHRMDAMRPRWHIGSLGHSENAELRTKLKHKFGLQVLHSAGEISKQEELAGVNGLSGEDVLAVDMSQPDRCQIQP